MLEDVSMNIFKAIKDSPELLTLLEVPSNSMKDVKAQIIEDAYPNENLDQEMSLICIFELPSTPSYDSSYMEKGRVEIDIYVPKSKNKIDRRVLIIADKVIDALDSKRRLKNGKQPVKAGINLSYYNRLPNMATDSDDWVKYGIIFQYDLVRI